MSSTNSNRLERSRSPLVARKPASRGVKSKRIVIDNIPFGTNWQKLKEVFREQVGFCGFFEIIEAANGKDLGMGIMELKTLDGAEKAIEKMHKFSFGGRNLVVHEETQRDKDRILRFLDENGGPAPNKRTGAGGGGLGSSMNNGRSRDLNSSLPPLLGDRRIDYGSPIPSSRDDRGSALSSQVLHQLGIDGPITDQVFVSNFDPRIPAQKLREVFSLAGRVVDVEVSNEVDLRSETSGLAIITFEQELEAIQAISLFNNQLLYNIPMKVKLHSPPVRPMGGSSLPEGLGSIGVGLGGVGLLGSALRPSEERGLGAGSSFGHLGGLGSVSSSLDRGYSSGGGDRGFSLRNDPISDLRSILGTSAGGDYGGRSNNGLSGRGSSSTNDSARTILVNNLPFAYTWKDLKRVFRDCGDIQFADVVMDGGKSKGVGTVKFSRPEEALRAVKSLNNVRCDGRNIRVELQYN